MSFGAYFCYCDCRRSGSCCTVGPPAHLPEMTSSRPPHSDGTRQNALANILVPGDIVSFTVGDRIPADVRLVRAIDLEIDESNLTGETKPRRKNTRIVEGFGMGHDPGISERTNTAFMGTLVRNGHGAGVVVATGQQSEFGVIFSMMQEVGDRKTPLQLSMDELAKKLSVISFAVIGVICLIGVYQQRSWLEMFTIGGGPFLDLPVWTADRALTLCVPLQSRSPWQPFPRASQSSSPSPSHWACSACRSERRS